MAAQLLLLYEAALQGGDAAARTAKTAAEALLDVRATLSRRRTYRPLRVHRRRSPPGGSPEAQRLVAFLNSAHLPDGDDQLADDRAGPWIAGWLADASRPAPAALVGQPAPAAAPAELLVVREGLRQLAAVNCGGQADPHRVAQAVARLERTPLLVELARARAAAHPGNRETADHGDDDDRRADPTTATAHPADHAAAEAARLVIAVVAGDYLAVRARGEWPRIKVCGSPDCRWAFVDGTRNRSRRWCDMAGCGNRAKNRAWRHRQTPVTS